MTKTTEEKIAVMQAYLDGKTIVARMKQNPNVTTYFKLEDGKEDISTWEWAHNDYDVVPTKKCEHCGEEFIDLTDCLRYCSIKCREKAQNLIYMNKVRSELMKWFRGETTVAPLASIADRLLVIECVRRLDAEDETLWSGWANVYAGGNVYIHKSEEAAVGAIDTGCVKRAIQVREVKR